MSCLPNGVSKGLRHAVEARLKSSVPFTMQGRAPAGNTGATALLRAARAVGTTVCFANPGTSEMQLVAALDDVDLGVRPVLCLQENVAVRLLRG